MNVLSCPGPDLLLLHHHGLLDEPEDGPERERVGAHLAVCETCRAWPDDALGAPALPFDPREALPALQARIDAWETEAAPQLGLDLDVRLLCTYCKDGLSTAQAFYCADCLAPHHDDCFAEHGRCSAPGCEGARFVRSTVAPRRGGSRERRGALLVLGVVLGGGAVAAWMPGGGAAEVVTRPEPTRPRSAPAPTTAALDSRAYRVEVYPIPDLVEVVAREPQVAPEPMWKRDVRAILDTRSVTLSFQDTPLGEVVAFLQDITGLNIVLSQDVDREDTVSLRLRDISLRDALKIVLEQTGLGMTLANESLVLHGAQGRWSVEPRYPPERPRPLLLAAEPTLRRVREAIEAEVPLGWRSPGSLALEGTALVLNHTEAGHARLRAELGEIRAEAQALRAEGRLGEGLADWHPSFDLSWWNAPGGDWVAPHTTSRALDLERQLSERRVTVDFADSPLEGVPAFLTEITGVAVRLDPALGSLAERPLNLRLREVTVANALELICAAVDPGLVWDIDRRGILLRRCEAPALEAQLREIAAHALEPEQAHAAMRERLHTQTVSCNFDATLLSGALSFLRDLSGLNLIVSAQASPQLARAITVRVRDVSLHDALELCLRPLGLGYGLESGVVMIVPRDQAQERTEIVELLAGLQDRALQDGDSWSPTVAQLAARLEASFEGDVVLDERLRRSRARVALPAELTIGEALSLAEPQLGLRFAWAWSDRPVLALARTQPGLLAQVARELAREPATSLEALRAADAEARASLGSSLADFGTLRALPSGAAGATVLRGLLATIQAGQERLADVKDATRWFDSGEDSEPNERGTWEAGEAVTRLLELDAERAGAARQGEARLERLELALREASSRFAASDGEHQAQLVELRQRAGSYPVGSPQRLGLEDRASQLEAERARERAALLEPVEQQVAASRRDQALQAARIESELGQWEQRFAETCGFVPGWDEARRALVSGSWEDAFPEGYRAWSAAQWRQGQEVHTRGLARLRRLGLVLEEAQGAPLRVTRVCRGGWADRAQVTAGERLRRVGPELVSSLDDVLRALAAPEELIGITLGFQSDAGEALPVREVDDTRRVPLEGEARLWPDWVWSDDPPAPEARLGVRLIGVDGGARVTEVDEPAREAGLRVGDVIVGFGGADVSSAHDVLDVLSDQEPGDRVTVTVARDGERLSLEVRLGQR